MTFLHAPVWAVGMWPQCFQALIHLCSFLFESSLSPSSRGVLEARWERSWRSSCCPRSAVWCCSPWPVWPPRGASTQKPWSTSSPCSSPWWGPLLSHPGHYSHTPLSTVKPLSLVSHPSSIITGSILLTDPACVWGSGSVHPVFHETWGSGVLHHLWHRSVHVGHTHR